MGSSPRRSVAAESECLTDPSGALGAYARRVFDGRTNALAAHLRDECDKQLGAGTEVEKTAGRRATSFGAGRCVLMKRPLDHSVALALVSTATKRAGKTLMGRISYLFEGMSELVARLADERIETVVMPLLGAGKGGIGEPLAYVGLLLALAEAIAQRDGGHHLQSVTIVLFKAAAESPPSIDPTVVRRGLALVAAQATRG